jgi:hypothetical protein
MDGCPGANIDLILKRAGPMARLLAARFCLSFACHVSQSLAWAGFTREQTVRNVLTIIELSPYNANSSKPAGTAWNDTGLALADNKIGIVGQLHSHFS